MDIESAFPYRVYINLGYREDRRHAVEYEFTQQGFAVRRQPAVKAAWLQDARGYETKPRYACALSICLAVRRARRLRAPAVLIFEDDCLLHPAFRRQIAGLHLPEDWGLFYFGCQHRERPVALGNGLVRVVKALDTHAFAIRAPYYNRVLQAMRGLGRGSPVRKIASDLELAALHSEIPTYAAWPNLAWQAVSPSAITGVTYSNYAEDGRQVLCQEMLAGLDEEMAAATTGHPWGKAGEE